MNRSLSSILALTFFLAAVPAKAEEPSVHDKARERREQIAKDRDVLKNALQEAEARQKAERKDFAERYKAAHAEMEARHKKEAAEMSASYDAEKTAMLRRHEKERVDMVGRYDPVIKTDADELRKAQKKK
jgi:membrane-bound lytic murein transglycosylase